MIVSTIILPQTNTWDASAWAHLSRAIIILLQILSFISRQAF